MKIVINLERDLFEQAEKAARRLGVSQNEFHRRALDSFLKRQDDVLTAQLNEVYTEQPTTIDSLLAQLQFASLPYSSW